jgi:hypothetical protein
MTLRFLAIDPDTNGENCPALFLEEETGDLLFQGWMVTDPLVLAESSTSSPRGETEPCPAPGPDAGDHPGGAWWGRFRPSVS